MKAKRHARAVDREMTQEFLFAFILKARHKYYLQKLSSPKCL